MKTVTILPTLSIYLDDLKAEYNDEINTTLIELGQIDQSRFKTVTKLPMTVPELLIGKYLLDNRKTVTNDTYSDTDYKRYKFKIIIDDVVMENMYMVVRKRHDIINRVIKVIICVVTTLETSAVCTAIEVSYNLDDGD